MENDAVYYSRRAREERDAASRSSHCYVRNCHLEMAQAYELRTRFLLAEPEQLEIMAQLVP
jgi:hypothetical protein